MKNILLPFLSLAMVLLVGCTEDFGALNEAEVTQPVITSSLDDITFSANFTLRSVGTSSFIIDPKSEDISRNNFSVDFSDENYTEDGDAYLTSTVTESSSVNGYTLRLTPTQYALDLVDTHVLKCYININLDDGRVTRYSIDVTLNGDTPLFYDHPDNITFPSDFTVDSLQYIEFSVQPGVYEIDTDRFYLTTSDNSTTSSNNRNTYYDVLSTEVTDIDSVGTISYMMTIAPSSQAVRMISDSDVEYLLVVRMIYTDTEGERNYVDSYDFDMVFSSKYEGYGFSADRGIADIVFPESFTNYTSTTTYVGTTYFYVDLGTDGLSVIDNLVLAGSGLEADSLINYDISTITEVSTTTTLGTYQVTLYSAVNSIDLPNGAILSCNVILITDEEVYDSENPVDGEGCDFREIAITMPPYNENNVLPTVSTVPTMIYFHSDTRAYDVQKQHTSTLHYWYGSGVTTNFSDLTFTFAVNRGNWTETAIKENIEVCIEYSEVTTGFSYNRQVGWIDEIDLETDLLCTVEGATVAATGYLLDTYTLQLRKSEKCDTDMDAHYSDIYNEDAYSDFIGDTGSTYVYLKVKYKDGEDGGEPLYIESSRIPVRFYPPTPKIEELYPYASNTDYGADDYLAYVNNALDTGDYYASAVGYWTSTYRDFENYINWWDAIDYCANKERVIGVPWDWRMPTLTEVKSIIYGKTMTTGLHYKVAYNEYATSGSLIGTTWFRNEFTGNTVYYPQILPIWSTATYGSGGAANGTTRVAAVRPGNATQYNHSPEDLLTVVCVLDKYQYPDTDIVPDVGEFVYTDDPIGESL